MAMIGYGIVAILGDEANMERSICLRR